MISTLKHITDNELDMVETDSMLFEEKELVPSATPKNIKVLVDTINQLISFNNAIQEKNRRLEQQLQLANLIKRM